MQLPETRCSPPPIRTYFYEAIACGEEQGGHPGYARSCGRATLHFGLEGRSAMGAVSFEQPRTVALKPAGQSRQSGDEARRENADGLIARGARDVESQELPVWLWR